MLQSGHILCQAPPRQRLQERPAAFNMKMAQRKDGAAVQIVLPPLLATAGATGGEGMGGGGGKPPVRRRRRMWRLGVAAAGSAPHFWTHPTHVVPGLHFLGCCPGRKVEGTR